MSSFNFCFVLPNNKTLNPCAAYLFNLSNASSSSIKNSGAPKTYVPISLNWTADNFLDEENGKMTSISYLFKFGYILQQESDETL